jgi:hopanoid biosynthesis associated radical SAM protein HpnH
LYVCTNALLLEEKLDQYKPTKYLSFSVHLDGPRKEHDFAVCRLGTYDKAVSAIKLAVKRGFRVTTNTTVFQGADLTKMRGFFDDVMKLGVESMMVSPAYQYDKAPDQDHFLGRQKSREFFQQLFANPKRAWRFNLSPLFMRFLMGKEELRCKPWGNPTYNIFGWQKPCYLIQEGYAATFKELMEDTAWDNYGTESGNAKCSNCMMHSGYEPAAVDKTFTTISGFSRTALATVTGAV